MATERQIAANRLNASKSTGPRTEAGKAVSRANALTHGMAGEGVVVDEANRAAFEDRRRKWAPEYRPSGEGQEWALDRLVAASFRIETCEEAIDASLADQSARARLAWDLDRRVEASAVAARLARDPVRTSARLETSRHGVELLAGLWARLGEAIEAEGCWSEDEESAALDLLGVPVGLRRGRTPIDPPDGVDAAEFRRALVADEVDRLESLAADSLDELDARDRLRAESGLSGLLSKETQRLFRYERDAWRRFREATRDLRTGHCPAQPAPQAPPEPPRPEPKPPEAKVPPRATPVPVPVVATPGRTAEPPQSVAIKPAPPSYSYVDIAVGSPRL